ncbi:hypothetical protein ACF0H5_023391 [Mactra antiquata]
MSNSRIQRQVECPICFEQFTSPKVLPCQHTFCLRCLESHHRSNGGGNRIRCPECRTEHQIPSNRISEFPTSVAIQRLIEALSVPNVPQQQPSAPPLQPTRSQDSTTRTTQRAENEYELHSDSLDDGVTLGAIYQRDTGGNVGGNRASQNTSVLSTRQSQPNNRGNDVDLDILRVTSLLDQQRKLVKKAGRNQNRQSTSAWTTRECEQNERQTSNRTTASDANNGGYTHLFAYARRNYRKYLGRLFKGKDAIKNFLICHLIIVTFARCMAGLVKLTSDCQDESNAAVYLFVKSLFEFFLHVTILVCILKDKLEKALDYLIVQIWMLIQTVFSVVWLFVGTAWIFGNYKDMKNECPIYVEDWDFHFINFAVFLTVVDWIGAVIFAIYSLYVIFEINEGSDNTENSV